MRPLIVGLTGGIGSGKSTICGEFSRLGVPIIDADHIAREVVAIGQPALHGLEKHFGKIILNRDGSLNRSILRKIIFNDPQQRVFVEELLHPLILQQIKQQVEKLDTPYVIIEIPLLIEAGWQPFVDQVLIIDLPEELQIKRLAQRGDFDGDSIEQVMKIQLGRTERVKHADQIIDNSGEPGDLSSQISELHQQYLLLAEMRHQ